MTDPPFLRRDLDEAAFDALHDRPAEWCDLLSELVGEEVVPPAEGSVLVGLSAERVVKVYPPFMRDDFTFEVAALAALDGRLSIATPRLLESGERAGWPYLIMSRLAGEPLTRSWPSLDEPARERMLEAIGSLIAEVHGLPVAPLSRAARPWPVFLRAQKEGCRARQQRKGLPAHLFADLEAFVAPEPEDVAEVILTGEYTPMNLLVHGGQLTGMIDFGDGLVGPAAYDWLGPMCFLAAGHRRRHEALLRGYGFTGSLDRRRLLRLLLLHRYSNLGAQVAVSGWREAADLDGVAARIWPE